MDEVSTISSFYSGKNILVTGGTGFLGKILLEKLLRSCPDLGCIYLLVRAKKGKHVHARTEELFDDVVFERLRNERPKFRHQVQAITGDCSLPGLGISDSDRKFIQERTDIVFHAAATVRFDEKLRLATAINVNGCREMLNLCKNMPNLKALIHVSTAYANCPISEIDEQFFSAPNGMSPDKLISLSDNSDDKRLDQITPALLGAWPNTYSFTKAIAEVLVGSESDGLPVGVFRPSIVVSTYREPVRGWVDNLYGATGVCAGAGVGILRTLHCNPECVANIIPVDTCVNALVCSAWDVAQNKNKPPKVYNYVSTEANSLTWGEFMDLCETNGILYPSVRAVWYYSLTLNKHWLIHWLYVIFLHLIPGLLVDVALVCAQKKPKMLRAYKHIIKYNKAISYFCLNTWSFKYDNVLAMWDKLTAPDREIFFFDMRKLDWKDYFVEHMLGVRKYLLKDDISTLEQARTKWRLFYWMHQLGKVAFAFVFLRLAWYFISLLF